MGTLTIRTDPEVESALAALTSGGNPGLRLLALPSLRPNGHSVGRNCEPRPWRCATIRKMSRPRVNWPPRWTPSVRGDLYRLKAPRDARGHEQAGTRYAVVLQSDDVLLSTWLIAPTSTGRRAASFRPEVEISGVKTRVMVEQLTAIDPAVRLGEFAGRLDHADMQAIDTALRAMLALD